MWQPPAQPLTAALQSARLLPVRRLRSPACRLPSPPASASRPSSPRTSCMRCGHHRTTIPPKPLVRAAEHPKPSTPSPDHYRRKCCTSCGPPESCRAMPLLCSLCYYICSCYIIVLLDVMTCLRDRLCDILVCCIAGASGEAGCGGHRAVLGTGRARARVGRRARQGALQIKVYLRVGP